jgi:hypothetical protein
MGFCHSKFVLFVFVMIIKRRWNLAQQAEGEGFNGKRQVWKKWCTKEWIMSNREKTEGRQTGFCAESTTARRWPGARFAGNHRLPIRERIQAAQWDFISPGVKDAGREGGYCR